MTVPRRERSPFYDLVAGGLGVYARTHFRVRALGERFRLDPGLIVSSHRSDDDVPVLIAAVYRSAHGILRRGRQLHFAVRDDLFLPGFFGGYPPGLSTPARRALFPIGIGRVLEGALPCHPIRSATRMRIVEVLREHPDAPLDELLSGELAAPFHERGLRRDARAAQALAGRYADLLWRVCGDDELVGPLAAESWRRRAAAATGDFRRLVEIVRGGGTLLIFPEGRPSPDGELGPVQRGLEALIRRGRPATLRAVAPAYDPLVGGRPYAYVGVGAPVELPLTEAEVLRLLRRTTPLTPAQLVAAGAADRAGAEIESALADGRPVAPELLDRERRRERLAEARSVAAGLPLDRLVREYRSARG